MAIKVICSRCLQELDEPGALVISPPDKVEQVRKFHLCLTCYHELTKWIWCG